jgi:hypothetical protein
MKTHLMSIVRSAAEHAHRDLFSSRRGLFEADEADGLIVAYDNNPCAGDARCRHRELERMKAAATAGGSIEVVAEASYPAGGPDDGYTVAILFRAEDPDDAIEAIAEAWRHAVLNPPADAR